MLSWLDVCAGTEQKRAEAGTPHQTTFVSRRLQVHLAQLIEMLPRNGSQSAINKIFW